ncbi:pentapeptide repeat-containing protein [Micromonospora sp. NPDC023956]|uniref:pentapeptide repeat-containing protein n=1 Tax=Micromonospora sp. NPDC023956 TaxID=3155722 RepID=UPI0033F666E7
MPTFRDRLAAVRTAWDSGSTTPQTPPGQRVPGPRRRHRAPASVVLLPPQQQSGAQNAAQIVTALAAVAAVLFTLWFSIDTSRKTDNQIKLSRAGQIADRFNRAIDQLGQAGPDKLSIRLGGIYSLERIMKDSPDDALTIIEVLCAFVRTNVPRPPGAISASKAPRSAEDIRAAVTVLGRRPNPDPAGKLDFTGTQLSLPDLSLARGQLSGTDLIGANLSDTDLGAVDLTSADLHGADLHAADLRSANLTGANLDDAELYGASLFEADLRRANLNGADLRGADLTRADLHGADLSDADLRGAKALTDRMLQCTVVNGLTRLPTGVSRPADVPVSQRLQC